MPGVEEGGGVRQRVGRGGMNLEKAVNHGVHSDHAAKATGPWAQIPLGYRGKSRAYVHYQITRGVSTKECGNLRLFAVCAVFAVVELWLLRSIAEKKPHFALIGLVFYGFICVFSAAR